MDDRYPIPHMHDLNSKLKGCKKFSVLDLQKGYYQIPMAKGDIPKTAVITPFGCFEFLRMPFGLKNAAQAFQRLMDSISPGLPFTFIYLDDILIASPDSSTHYEHLRQVLKLLSDHGLILNWDKCAIHQDEITFIGHQVSLS
ncbi:Pol polyprotein, partial [Caligus rogercresseyi]